MPELPSPSAEPLGRAPNGLKCGVGYQNERTREADLPLKSARNVANFQGFGGIWQARMRKSTFRGDLGGRGLRMRKVPI